MCLCSQLPRTGSLGHWLKQKSCGLVFLAAVPSLLGQAFAALCQVLWIPLPCSGTAIPSQQCSLTVEVTVQACWCLPQCCALPCSHSPRSELCTVLLHHMGPTVITSLSVLAGARVLRHEQWGGGDSSAPQMMPLALGCSPGWLEAPRGSTSTGPGPHAVPQMDTQEGSGHSMDRSWGTGQRLQVIWKRRDGRLRSRFALPRADVVGLAQWWEAAGRFAVTTGAKLGWPREGKSRGEGMCD